MNEFWYPWYPEVFAADTMHLTAEQDGIYRRLLDHYMKTRRPLPDSDVALARIATVSDLKWLDASSIVRAFFKHKEGMLFHAFCDQQLDKQDKLSRRRSEIAEKAAKKRWKGNQQDTCIEHAPRMLQAQQMHATGQDKTEQKKKEKLKQKENPAFENFWGLFPSERPKGNKQAAFVKFTKATKSGVPEHDLIERARSYASFCGTTGSYNQHAVTWLNQRGWETDWAEQSGSDPGAVQAGNRSAAKAGTSIDDTLAKLKQRHGSAQSTNGAGAAEGQSGLPDVDAGSTRPMLENPETVRNERNRF